MFNHLGLSAHVLEGVKAMGYTEPTPIQLRAIPLILNGTDVIGSAQTGTGKTAAFALPILTRIKDHGPHIRVLVLEPTRELAAQVETSFHDLARFTNIRTTVVYGGVGYGKQREELKRGVDVLVATPGRLLDHVSQGSCNLSHVDHLVIDEGDRMLDMGFLPDVRRIIEKCSRQRHTSLFSATIPPEIDTLIRWAMKSPQTVEIGLRRSPAETVRHVVYPVADDQKTDLLCAILNKINYDSAIIFCRTRRRADRVAHMLKSKQHSVAILHSSRTQREREQALRGFRDGRYEVLVATDIAARGLDIADVSHVINFDVPQHPEDYVHRIGRTGRAQATGDAFTLMVAEDRPHMQAIERFISRDIERIKLDDFPYRYTSLFDDSPKKENAPVSRGARAIRVHGGYYCGPSKRRR